MTTCSQIEDLRSLRKPLEVAPSVWALTPLPFVADRSLSSGSPPTTIHNRVVASPRDSQIEQR